MSNKSIRALPRTPIGESPQTTSFLGATKEILDTITGKRDGQIATLPPGASNAEIIDKVNEIINRLQ